ncbi:glycerate dehydrogenase [bacterium BMS3Abin11]|nr:glycerate dehydrogenase [bacterium BMS3Abin11]GMT40562.1 MAG: glycerate dehydrogenase [bacterium]
MKKAVFLDLATIGPDELSLSPLEDLPLSWEYHRSTSPVELPGRIKDAEIIVTNKCRLNIGELLHASQLKYICTAATGFNHIDVDAAKAKDAVVSNVRGYATSSVVQHVYALILTLSTKLREYNSAVRNGDWQHSENFCLLNFPIEEVSGKTLGIIGYGTLGQAVAKVAPAFGLEVLICQHLYGELESGRLELDDLLARADIISLHLPLNKRTTNLLGERELSLMKPNALLINTGRGGIVDELALADALRQKRIAGAGVDVLATEPPIDESPLLGANIPNLIVTPHTAWASRQSRQRLVDQIADNIRSFLAGEIVNRVG